MAAIPSIMPWDTTALDEISKPVVVASLTASRGRHGDHHRKFAYAAQLVEHVPVITRK
jgi:hypothetical protein